MSERRNVTGDIKGRRVIVLHAVEFRAYFLGGDAFFVRSLTTRCRQILDQRTSLKADENHETGPSQSVTQRHDIGFLVWRSVMEDFSGLCFVRMWCGNFVRLMDTLDACFEVCSLAPILVFDVR